MRAPWNEGLGELYTCPARAIQLEVDLERMQSKVGNRPGQEVALTDRSYHTWACTCLTDGRILVQCNHLTEGWGYYLMTPKVGGKPTFEASPSLYLYNLKDGSTRQVSTKPGADYRFPHGEATPKQALTTYRRPRSMRLSPTMFLLLWSSLLAAPPAAGDWPQFHGPNRDNKSADTGLLKEWPEGGPERIWQATGIGEGYSNVAIADQRIYTTGSIDDDCVITALDMEGKKLWNRKNGKAWKRSYPGTRSTPTIVDGVLYHLSGIGNLLCLDLESNEPVWTVNILEEFGGRNIMWGLAESPLIIGDHVICTPGGKEVSMVALDRKTGKPAWKCTGAGNRPGYASPILIDYQGLQQIVTAMSESIVGVRVSDGKLLWQYPHKVYADENITTPLFHDGLVIVSGCVRKGTTSLRLQVSGNECSVSQEWHSGTLDNKQGGIVLEDGRLYGYAEHLNSSTPWVCIDFESGEDVFKSAPVKSSYKYKNGCLTFADGMFYLYSDDGKMALAKATDDGFQVTGRLRLEEPGERPTWAHPVVCGGRLYIRHGDRLSVYDVRKK